jgi:hypothetical protein
MAAFEKYEAEKHLPGNGSIQEKLIVRTGIRAQEKSA